ncbi:MAG: radical SAM protein [Nitrospirota bacterium]
MGIIAGKFRRLAQLIRYSRTRGPLKVARIIKKSFYCKVSGYPNSLMIEAASKCNLSCAMCWAYKAYERRRNNFLSYTEYKKIIDDIEFFCSKIFFSFCGEPLLNKDIYKMIEYANQKNILVGLSTNAMLLTEENAIKLLEAKPAEVIISLDATNKDIYEAMRIGGDFDTALQRAKFLAEEKKRRKQNTPEVILQMVVTKKNESEIDEFIKLSEAISADGVCIKSMFIDHHGDESYRRKLIDEYLPVTHDICRYTKCEDGSVILKKTGLCPNINSPVIASDGNVHICCFDILGEYKQGNAIEENFCDIWHRNDYVQFRNNIMLNRKLPLCQVCVYSDVPEVNICCK